MSPTNKTRVFKDWLGVTAERLAESRGYHYQHWVQQTDGSTWEYFAVAKDDRGEPVRLAFDKKTNAVAEHWKRWIVGTTETPPMDLAHLAASVVEFSSRVGNPISAWVREIVEGKPVVEDMPPLPVASHSPGMKRGR